MAKLNCKDYNERIFKVSKPIIKKDPMSNEIHYIESDYCYDD